jgi:hypothetical protein
MTIEISKRTIHVALPEDIMRALLVSFNAGLDAAFPPVMAAPIKQDCAPKCKNQLVAKPAKYSAYCIVPITAQTLPEIFSQCIDIVADLAPEAVDKLAKITTSARRFVSKSKDGVHRQSSHLPTIQTKSGWWGSANISKEDLKRALQALAKAAGLEFGKDVWFESSESF